MDNSEYTKQLRSIIYTSRVNMQYHSSLEGRYRLCRRIFLSVIILLEVVSLWVFAFLLSNVLLTLCLTMLAVTLPGFAILFTPVDNEKFHRKMFYEWSYLLRDALCLDDGYYGTSSTYCSERLRKLLSTMETLHTKGSSPWMRLLTRCQENENEREWGTGIRSYEQVEAERKRRESL